MEKLDIIKMKWMLLQPKGVHGCQHTTDWQCTGLQQVDLHTTKAVSILLFENEECPCSLLWQLCPKIHRMSLFLFRNKSET